MGPETKFTNEGNIRIMNRAARRRKPLKPRFNIVDYIIVPENINTKPSHKYNKIREENVRKEKRQRERAIIQARKDRKENLTQVS
jgi:hypothetical protein